MTSEPPSKEEDGSIKRQHKLSVSTTGEFKMAMWILPAIEVVTIGGAKLPIGSLALVSAEPSLRYRA